MKHALLLLAMALLSSACDGLGAVAPTPTPTPLPTATTTPSTPAPAYNAPSYIKEVAAYAEGWQAFMVYFSLADKAGNPTAWQGTGYVQIYDDNLSLLYQKGIEIKASDFRLTTVGQGAFEREALVYVVGRIPYTQFERWPATPGGKVKLWLMAHSPRKTMEAQEVIYFDR